MKNLLASKNTKLSVLFAFAGFIFATLIMWLAVALGFAPIQLPLPSTAVVIVLLLLAFWGMLIYLGVDVTKDAFSGENGSWGATLMVPIFWLWILLSGGLITALGAGAIHFFFTVLWIV